MMAQLAEETQPFFEITLKSKAVSENCNVKFSCVVTGESSHRTSHKRWNSAVSSHLNYGRGGMKSKLSVKTKDASA